MKQFCNFTKQELLARVGNIEQLASITHEELLDGNASCLHQWRIRNAGGVEFTVLESKCMSLFSMTYRGIPIEYISKNGLTSPLRFVPQSPEESLRSIDGGILYTCGLSNVGFACQTELGEQVYHGRLRAMSAKNTESRAFWDGDIYRMQLRGEMRETAMFGENLVLRRTISTQLGASRIQIEDEIENEGFEPRPLMLMYHCNLGYPLLDADAKLLLPPSRIDVRDSWTRPNIPDFLELSGPDETFKEQVLYHQIQSRETVVSALINRRLNLAFYVKQDPTELPYIHEWKAFHSGDYALGLEPANCHCEGQAAEREKYGTLQLIQPFEKKKVHLEIGFLESEEIDHLLETGRV